MSRRRKLRILTNEYRIPYSSTVFPNPKVLIMQPLGPCLAEVSLPQIASFVNTLGTFLFGMVTRKSLKRPSLSDACPAISQQP